MMAIYNFEGRVSRTANLLKKQVFSCSFKSLILLFFPTCLSFCYSFICHTYFVQYSTFFQKDPDDLPFQKGDVLTIVSQDEESWWTAENRTGQRGSIPVPYVQIVSEEC